MKDDPYEFKFNEDLVRSSDLAGRLNISGNYTVHFLMEDFYHSSYLLERGEWIFLF